MQAITLIIGTLGGAKVFGADNYDTLITKAALHGAKLLKKSHQATAVGLASHLWWQEASQTIVPSTPAPTAPIEKEKDEEKDEEKEKEKGKGDEDDDDDSDASGEAVDEKQDNEKSRRASVPEDEEATAKAVSTTEWASVTNLPACV